MVLHRFGDLFTFLFYRAAMAQWLNNLHSSLGHNRLAVRDSLVVLAESGAVIHWVDADMADKSSAHGFRILKPRFLGDHSNLQVGILQIVANQVRSDYFHVFGWRDPGFQEKGPGEVSGAHIDSFGEHGNTQVRSSVIHNSCLQATNVLPTSRVGL